MGSPQSLDARPGSGAAPRPPAERPADRSSDRVLETRRRILQSAASCFSRFGFSRTRVDDVAAGADVSRALVYEYFESKPNLLRAVQEQAIADFFARVERCIDAAEGVADAITGWLRLCLTEGDRQPLFRAIFADDAVAASAHWEEVTARTRARWLERLGALLAAGVRDGELRADLDVPATAAALRALQVGLTQQLVATSPVAPVAPEQQVEAAVTLVLGGLLASARAPSTGTAPPA